MTIAICDDSAIDCILSKFLISEYFKKRKMTCSIITYETGAKLLSDFENGTVFDIVFMDIYMEKENGIDTAQKLRKFDRDCLLVFTTTSTDHALEGFRVRALHYLVKPYSDDELDMLLDEISQKISVEEKYIEIPSASDSLRIKLCDILYAEHFKHCIHIHCTDKSEKSVRSTFAEFVMLFDDGDNFFVCNRGIIVNLEHIRDMNGNEFVLDNGERISISRSLVKSAKSTFSEYIFGRRDLH